MAAKINGSGQTAGESNLFTLHTFKKKGSHMTKNCQRIYDIYCRYNLKKGVFILINAPRVTAIHVFQFLSLNKHEVKNIIFYLQVLVPFYYINQASTNELWNTREKRVYIRINMVHQNHIHFLLLAETSAKVVKQILSLYQKRITRQFKHDCSTELT